MLINATCNCNNNDNAIILVRGNDTNFNNAQFLTIYLRTTILDLSTFKAVFKLGSITRTFNDISSGKIELNFTAAETAKMLPECYGSLNLIDNSNRIATIESLIPFKVISTIDGNAIATHPYTLNFDVQQGGENILNVSVESAVTVNVGSTVTLPAGSNATVTNVGTDNHLILNFGIPKGIDGNVISVNGQSGVVELDYSDVNALSAQTTINDLTTETQQAALNSGANTENIGQISTNTNDILTINTILSGYGNIVTHNVSEFATSAQGALADSALQSGDNISELTNNIGYITSAALPTLADLTTSTQMDAINSGITSALVTQIGTNQSNISAINGKIPSAATTTNQLADKDFVNSSIATNTANFIGTFNSVSALNAYSGTVTNNDYAFVVNSVITDNGNDWATFAALDAYNKDLLTNFDYAWVINGTNFDLYRFDILNQDWILRVSNTSKAAVTLNTAYNRYKATVTNNTTTWDYEYTLNNSSFTASQWAAINSGITTTAVTQIGINTTNIALKQDALVSGTNIKTINSNSILGSGDLTIDSLPSQTGQSGKFLTTDGTNASWATVDALPSQSGQNGKFLTTNGTAASWASVNTTVVTFRDWSV